MCASKAWERFMAHSLVVQVESRLGVSHWARTVMQYTKMFPGNEFLSEAVEEIQGGRELVLSDLDPPPPQQVVCMCSCAHFLRSQDYDIIDSAIFAPLLSFHLSQPTIVTDGGEATLFLALCKQVQCRKV